MWQAYFVGEGDPVEQDFVEEDLVGVREESGIFLSDLDAVFLDRKSAATTSSQTGLPDRVIAEAVCHFSANARR